MKYVTLIVIFALVGCSYVNRETNLETVNVGPWQAETHNELVSFSSICGNKPISVSFNPTLKSDAGAYFFLFIPVGSANSLNRAPGFLNVYVQYPDASSECLPSDVSAVVDGVSFSATSASQTKNGPLACAYAFKPGFGQSGSWLFQFNKSTSCEIPNLKLFYKTKEKLKYDKLQG